MQAGEKQVRVLVADDSAFSRKLVEQTLSEKRYSLVLLKAGAKRSTFSRSIILLL
jgi:hypothetical protein